jgi:hypothetical protein
MSTYIRISLLALTRSLADHLVFESMNTSYNGLGVGLKLLYVYYLTDREREPKQRMEDQGHEDNIRARTYISLIPVLCHTDVHAMLPRLHLLQM